MEVRCRIVTGFRARTARWAFRRRLARRLRRADFAELGATTLIHPPAAVTGRRHIRVGEASYILAGSWLAVAGEGASIPGLRIGARSYLGRDLTIVCAHDVWIGDDVMGSDRLYIADVEYLPGPSGRRLAPPRPVRIEDGVFLGTGATVLPGVTVGANSLVGAGAVVTQDVPPNASVAGNPARIIRRYDTATATWVGGDGVETA